MCTAISYKAKDFYFGRTLDYESSYGEEVVYHCRGIISFRMHIWENAQRIMP